MAIALMNPLAARQAPGAGACRIAGRASSGTTPLPGVAIAVKSGDALRVATSTETDGGYAVNLAPGQYTLTAELTGFTRVERPLVVAADGACAQTVDLALSLAPRQAPAAAAPQRGAVPGGRRGAGSGTNVVQVQPQAEAGAQTQTTNEREAEDAATRLLLPPGFSTETPSDAITIAGNNASLDRGMLNDRFDAIGRGVFDPATGEFGTGFGEQVDFSSADAEASNSATTERRTTRSADRRSIPRRTSCAPIPPSRSGRTRARRSAALSAAR